MWYEAWTQVCLTYKCLISLLPLVDKTVLSVLNCLCTFKTFMAVFWLSFWTSYSFPFIYVLILLLTLNCLDYYSFTVNLEFRSCESSTLFLFKVVLGVPVPFLFHNLRITLSVFYKVYGDFGWVCIECKDQFGRIILTKLNFPIHIVSMSLHLFRSF